MKTLFIVGLVAWLIYQATQPQPEQMLHTMNIGPTNEDDTPREYPNVPAPWR